MSFAFWDILKLSALILFLGSIYKNFLRPIYLLQFYKQQGIYTKFSPLLSFLLDALKNAQKHGDFFYWFKKTCHENSAKCLAINWGPVPMIFISDSSYSKIVMQKIENYNKDLSTVGMMDKIKNAMIFQDGKKWKRTRKVFSTAFHYEYLKNAVPLFLNLTLKKFKELESSSSRKVNAVEFFGSIAGEATGQFFFGKDFSNHKVGSKPLTTAAIDSANNICDLVLDPWVGIFGTWIVKLGLTKRFRDIMGEVDEVEKTYTKIITEARKNPTGEKNVLSLMFNYEDTEDKFSDTDIVQEFAGLFGAGTETTALLLSASTYYLWKHPQYIDKIKEEAKRELSDESKIDIDAINRMEFTTAFLKETLRLSGPTGFMFPRVAIQDHKIEELKIKKGTLVNFLIPVIHTDEKNFTRAKEFLPERFLGDSLFPNDSWRKDPYAYTPFSYGPKNCIGQQFSMIEAKLVLGMLVMRYKIKYPEDFELKMGYRFAYCPLVPLEPEFI